jgi:uncharacterized phosphosugar-binding protein
MEKTMLAHRFADAVHETIKRIEATQMESIGRAADLIAAALANGGAFWVYQLGHGGERELTNRAGGLMATRVFSFGFHVESPIAESLKNRPRAAGAADVDLETVRLAVKRSAMRAGDVLMLASVSGKNRDPIELTLAAQGVGAKVIGITSLEYTAQVESLHPSGKKLCDVADVVIDNCAPFGDACVEVPGYEQKALPISGVAQIAIGWMVCAEVIEKLQAMGKPPHVYMSQNRPGGAEYNERALREYSETGY